MLNKFVQHGQSQKLLPKTLWGVPGIQSYTHFFYKKLRKWASYLPKNKETLKKYLRLKWESQIRKLGKNGLNWPLNPLFFTIFDQNGLISSWVMGFGWNFWYPFLPWLKTIISAGLVGSVAWWIGYKAKLSPAVLELDWAWQKTNILNTDLTRVIQPNRNV